MFYQKQIKFFINLYFIKVLLHKFIETIKIFMFLHKKMEKFELIQLIKNNEKIKHSN